VLTLNLKRVFQITQAVTPLLAAASTPSSPSNIINIGSIDGLRVPALETFAYSASKAGLHHLSRVLASHLGPQGITSNTIACGPFESKMMKVSTPLQVRDLAGTETDSTKATLEQFKDVIESGVPLGRIGSPQDVAGTCIWLGSKAGSWVNGATIALDGGTIVASKL
jgi:NAD(P)-dependent dehydrogenase (short-subunit alcohol dehydrogenase family)